jgi:hypothetical protein
MVEPKVELSGKPALPQGAISEARHVAELALGEARRAILELEVAEEGYVSVV